MILLEKSILSRLSRLGEDVNSISSTGDLSSRVSLDGDDELSALALEINNMLENLNQTENRLQQAKLSAEAANRSKDEFLANMSHELRTPLNSIIGFSEILMLDKIGELNDRQEKYVRNVSKSGKHLLGLINGILDISKVEAGKMELHYEEFTVPSVIDEVKMIIAPLTSEKNLKLKIDIDSHLSTIVADRIKFVQIIYNLVSNSIKFTPDRGTISIDGKLDGKMVSISVEDTGIGISKENHDLVFQPFSQIDSAANRQYAGTGLGLALVKQFVEMHGGDIWFESEVGKGTKFTFIIPVEKTMNDLDV
ncbi:signal transduction histidine kinase [Methanohalophilus levihalophilus]|uniref:sensor histidine kinase n=1 Tax=Methanohalophilus levihalophilus TaxID=1431282 RepID=UPI001FD8ACFB|nr:ATP-binding protein [Methanohalophilus levihalophilus]MBP2031309.1 signal transduction histidine kinase [Methanohalophilus levihalophilus]